ncbi:hypothetical protein DFQ14_104232 [Halopolyspora algeriensis]|uniref:Uncharacterized protein n=1 Tax=Halopolyspora algeriensis TaxID=1500506 RepID=A0A368VU89_9ACTN|nr:DUF5947 family protein [Halopolyspora algeriensis]RCW44643.1 hypothetical protein DFQ14_104232 [Halopolyspora algeriensis]TQM56004.1 hypothetical protein FHU43_0782 [Halopolyspora algeriensis]
MTTGAFERVVRRAGARRAEAAEHCDLCSAPVSAGHRHLFDTQRGELMCACRPCSLLFDREAASEGHYRRVPERRLRLDPVPTEALGVPVGLAFFVMRADGTVAAYYPSPAGPTEWEVDQQAWRDTVDRCPELAGLETDVEALLINTARDQQQYWIAPIDDCFRLVGVVRREWKGLSGGSTVWPEIERFFAELQERR